MEPNFGLEVSQNRHLFISDTAMDAILTVTARDIAVSGSVAAEVILVDCSGSMFLPSTKIAAAQRAATAAVDRLPDGTFFAIVQGTDHAEMCYPTTPRLAVADASTKAEAKRRIARMTASGGTRMGTWLTRARDLFSAHPAAIRHVVLLTDGQNQHEPPEELMRALAECDGHFFCDAGGIGDDWDPSELRRIANVLRGTADSVGDSELVDDFGVVVEAAMANVVPDLRIRVTTMRSAELSVLKQVYPRELDLTGNPARQPETGNGKTVREFSTGPWAEGDSRDYQLSLRMDRDGHDPMAKDLQVAMIELVVRPAGTTDTTAPAERCALPQSVLVHWTNDLALSSRLDPKVAHYYAQAELHKATFAGFDAYDAGRFKAAARAWGKAVQLATASGNTEVLTRLERLVEVIDAGQGTVRIKRNLSREDLLRVAAGSAISTPFSGEQRRKRLPPTGGDTRSAKPELTCADCGRLLPGTATFCGSCGRRLGGQRR